MTYINHFFKIKRLVKLLEEGYSGSSADLANELKVSRSTLYRYLDELKDYGADIRFCKSGKRYRLVNKFSMHENIFSDS